MKVALLLIFSVILTACASQVTNEPTQAMPVQGSNEQEIVVNPTTPVIEAPSNDAQTNTPSAEKLSPKTINVDVNEYAFAPSSLSAKMGQEITVVLTNSGERAHGFAIPEFGVNVYIEPGTEKSITFTPDKSGSYKYFCNVPCGPGHQSMTGTLIVS